MKIQNISLKILALLAATLLSQTGFAANDINFDVSAGNCTTTLETAKKISPALSDIETDFSIEGEYAKKVGFLGSRETESTEFKEITDPENRPSADSTVAKEKRTISLAAACMVIKESKGELTTFTQDTKGNCDRIATDSDSDLSSLSADLRSAESESKTGTPEKEGQQRRLCAYYKAFIANSPLSTQTTAVDAMETTDDGLREVRVRIAPSSTPLINAEMIDGTPSDGKSEIPDARGDNFDKYENSGSIFGETFEQEDKTETKAGLKTE